VVWRLPIVAAIQVASPDGAFDPTYQMQRPGLRFDSNNSHVSFGFGSYWALPDGPRTYQGWVFTYNTRTYALQGALNLAGATNGAVVWMSGGGIASDDQNFMYFATATTSRPPDFSAVFQNSIVQAPLFGNSVTGRYQPPDAVNRWNAYTWCSGDYLKKFTLKNLLSPGAWTCIPSRFVRRQ
jgi:hypothetical protein